MGRVKAKWHGAPFHDITTKKWLVTFEVEATPSVYDKTKDKPLSLDIKEFYDKRSNNANSYFHKLIDLMAGVLNSSHVEVHNRMIARYGQVDEDLGSIIMRYDIPWEKLDRMHVRPTTATRTLDDGKLYQVYTVMRGSRTYNTKEMSILIDGVVSEAKDLGIETLPPQEIERMKQQWLRK